MDIIKAKMVSLFAEADINKSALLAMAFLVLALYFMLKPDNGIVSRLSIRDYERRGHKGRYSVRRLSMLFGWYFFGLTLAEVTVCLGYWFSLSWTNLLAVALAVLDCILSLKYLKCCRIQDEAHINDEMNL